MENSEPGSKTRLSIAICTCARSQLFPGEDPTPGPLTCEKYRSCGHPREEKNPLGFDFVYVPPGSFWMGSPKKEYGRDPDEELHLVTITRGFYLGKYEITEEQYARVMGSVPSPREAAGGRAAGPGVEPIPNFPVMWVSWLEAIAFCRKLSQVLGSETQGVLLYDWAYRLPTEAEWEYACRAGTQTRFSFGDALECKVLIGGFPPNSCDAVSCCTFVEKYIWPHGGLTSRHPIDGKLPNPWGLFGMHCNVGEWCLDWYGPYSVEPVIDPRGPQAGTERVFRGCQVYLKDARSAARLRAYPEAQGVNIGIRILQPLPYRESEVRPAPPRPTSP